MPETAKQTKVQQKVAKRAFFRSVIAVVDAIFFLFAAVAAVWLVWILFADTGSHTWGLALLVVLLWAVIAYLLLPRLHRLLTTIYVPDYFIGRSRTSDGLLGDPVNLAFNGPQMHIHQAMQAAGWTLAEPVNLASSLKIIGSTLLRRSYTAAPVSTLKLFGRMQNFAYQKEVDGSPSKRHHVRFWKCPPDWPLPGGSRKVQWMAAASFDRAVGLSLFTLQVTHKIAADIDLERDHVIQTLKGVDPSLNVTVLKDFSTAYHGVNGGGDQIITDGDLPIVDVTILPGNLPAPDLKAIETNAQSPDPRSDDTQKQMEKIPRPFAVYAVLLLLVAEVISSIVSLVQTKQGWNASTVQWDRDLRTVLAEVNWTTQDLLNVVIIVGSVFIFLRVLLGVLMWAGYAGARTLLLLVSAFTVIYSFVGWWKMGDQITLQTSLIPLTAAIFLLIALTSGDMEDFVSAKKKFRRERRALRKHKQNK